MGERATIEEATDLGSAKQKLAHQTWTRDGYLISTDAALIPVRRLNEAFASPAVYWADAMPEAAMREMLSNSLCFALYTVPPEPQPADDDDGGGGKTEEPALTGFARCVTDFTTFVYLTDVWVDPACQGKGLGTWLIACVQEAIESMPYLRRSLLFTSDWERSVPFYERLMRMSVLRYEEGKGLAGMQMRGPAFPKALQ